METMVSICAWGVMVDIFIVGHSIDLLRPTVVDFDLQPASHCVYGVFLGLVVCGLPHHLSKHHFSFEYFEQHEIVVVEQKQKCQNKRKKFKKCAKINWRGIGKHCRIDVLFVGVVCGNGIGCDKNTTGVSDQCWVCVSIC